MNADQWRELERIFEQARELPAADHVAFVTRACGAADRLKADALSLLEADQASADFMAHSALDRLAKRWADEARSLSPGDTIGPYTIRHLLGSGGAGEVWRARDQRLARDVAIKILSPHFAGDGDRLRRFADEARAAGALNHPNILTVHDVGEHEGFPYLVTECLEGRSLRERMRGGAIPVSEAIAVAAAVCRGLAAAHAVLITHRDVKPENTFLKRDGGVKILDFGLARFQLSVEGVWSASSATVPGVILGTAGYIAPEQLKGEPVDGRADLFALGAMLYEMLTGQHPFRGANTFETLQAVLSVEPSDPSTINSRVPPALGRIVMRLLQKTPEARFQSAVDVAWALEQVEVTAGAALATQGRDGGAKRISSATAIIGASLLTAVVLLAVWPFVPTRPPGPAGTELTRFTWPLPPHVGLGSAPVISPDNRYVAFVGVRDDEPDGHLFILDRRSGNAPALIPGSERSRHPFWSSDGKSLAFFAKGRLVKMDWPGGAPVLLASRALFPFGGAWSASGTILFAPDVIMAGLRRVAADGEPSQSREATALDLSLGDTSHCWPVALPDGVHFLYFVRSAHDERRGTYIGRLDAPAGAPASMLMRADANTVYVPIPDRADGVLLYVLDGRLEARPFDPRTLRFSGDARTLSGILPAGTMLTQPAMLSATADVLLFADNTVPAGARLEVVDRKGTRLRLWSEAENQNWPRLSPDGRFLARQRVDPLRNTPDIWVEDLVRGTTVRVTTAVEPDIRPVWSGDGRHLAFVSGNLPFRPGTRFLQIASADGTGVVRTLPCPAEYCEPTDWTPTGLLVNVVSGGQRDVWIVPTADRQPQPLLAEAFAERDARMSGDGKWIAYVSEESGRPQVSVRTASGPPRRVVISSDGGDQPVWRRDGKELFFVDLQRQLRSVSVDSTRDGLPRFGLPGGGECARHRSRTLGDSVRRLA